MSETKGQKSKYIFLSLRIAVVVCGIGWGIYWVSRGQRWANLRQIFAQMNLWIFAGTLGIFILGQILIGLRWWLLLRTQSIHIGFWAAVRLHFLGLFYNNFMPSSVGGDLIRAWYVTRHTNKMFEAVLSVFVESQRVAGVLVAERSARHRVFGQTAVTGAALLVQRLDHVHLIGAYQPQHVPFGDQPLRRTLRHHYGGTGDQSDQDGEDDIHSLPAPCHLPPHIII